MKYFIDFEFLEGDVPCQIKGFSIPRWLIKPNNTIQPISVGICSSDGREYYAISKEFNLKEAWNRFEWEQKTINDSIPGAYKEYWLRNNVLKPIFYDMLEQTLGTRGIIIGTEFIPALPFNYYNFKRLLKECGKTNKQIAEEVERFITHNNHINWNTNQLVDDKTSQPVEFCGYYADYDWVVFCWLFGKMIDLPKGFPMYCIDLKQELERLNETLGYNCDDKGNSYKIQEHKTYPKQFNEHNALDDAKWNYELYKFLQNL